MSGSATNGHATSNEHPQANGQHHTQGADSSTLSTADSSTPRLANYIDGAFLPPLDGAYLDNVAPATSRLLCQLPRSQKSDVNKAVAAAKAAYPSWSATSLEQRAAYLDAIADQLQLHFDRLARMESEDAGKPYAAARVIDIPRAVKNFRFFAGAIRHDTTDSHWMADALNVTQRCPIGVAGLITPWNLPVYLLSWKVAPALAMGNTVVCKPSELTPMTADALAHIIHDVGLPPGVFNLVHGLGPEVGQSLVEHEDVSIVSFTGGTATGRRVAAAAAPSFKKVSLELGGKNSTLVFADCDYDKTVKAAVRASFTNAGQVCLCGSRLLVEQSIYERFVADFVAEVERYEVGDPATAQIGSLTSQAHRDKIEYYVDVARKEGGTIRCGGRRPQLPPPFDAGAFYLPTVITDLPPTARCSVEEIFGPVVTVHPFSSEEEALSIANGVRYGLAGSLFTSDVARVQRVTRRWETGMIWVNTWLHRDLRVPFGGVKESGLGSEGGRHSLEFWSNAKNICLYMGPDRV